MAAPPWPPFRAPTLGLSNVTVAGLLDVLRELASPRKEPADLPAGRVLDTQIEAQVHGPVDLQEDIELLVADPAFAPTALQETRCRNSLCDTDSLSAGMGVSGYLWRRCRTIFVDPRCPVSHIASQTRMGW